MIVGMAGVMGALTSATNVLLAESGLVVFDVVTSRRVRRRACRAKKCDLQPAA